MSTAPAEESDQQTSTGVFGPLHDRLAEEAATRWLYTGAQVVVARSGAHPSVMSAGQDYMGRPINAQTLFPLYCVGKPFVSVAILKLVAADELSLDDQVAHVVSETRGTWLDSILIEELLDHTAGTHVTNMILARILPESARLDWVLNAVPDATFVRGRHHAYSPFSSWYLLGLVVERVAGMSYRRFIEEEVLRDYGIPATDVVAQFDRNRFERERSRISVNLDMTIDKPVPLLAEAGPESACEWNPAYGMYSTMTGVAGLYTGVLRDLEGANEVLPASLVAEAVRTRYPPEFDAGLGREGSFGLGFMVGLSGPHYGGCLSERAFGHSGPGAAGLGIADPAHGIVIAAMFNSVLDVDTSDALRRRRLVEEVYRCLEVR